MSEDTHDIDRYKVIGVERECLMDAYMLAERCRDIFTDDKHLHTLYMACEYLVDIIMELDAEAQRLKKTLGDSVPDLMTNAKGGRIVH